jgi:hypothetical protein
MEGGSKRKKEEKEGVHRSKEQRFVVSINQKFKDLESNWEFIPCARHFSFSTPR